LSALSWFEAIRIGSILKHNDLLFSPVLLKDHQNTFLMNFAGE
jgi:hypothetical protein